MSEKFSKLLEKYIARSQKLKKDLGDAVGVSPEYIRMLESGKAKPPRYSVRKKLADSLELSPEERHFFLRQGFMERLDEEELEDLKEIESYAKKFRIT